MSEQEWQFYLSEQQCFFIDIKKYKKTVNASRFSTYLCMYASIEQLNKQNGVLVLFSLIHSPIRILQVAILCLKSMYSATIFFTSTIEWLEVWRIYIPSFVRVKFWVINNPQKICTCEDFVTSSNSHFKSRTCYEHENIPNTSCVWDKTTQQ